MRCCDAARLPPLPDRSEGWTVRKKFRSCQGPRKENHKHRNSPCPKHCFAGSLLARASTVKGRKERGETSHLSIPLLCFASLCCGAAPDLEEADVSRQKSSRAWRLHQLQDAAGAGDFSCNLPFSEAEVSRSRTCAEKRSRPASI